MIANLKRTFDYQRFSPNRRLSEIIEETERRNSALADDELFFVAAAGDISTADNSEDYYDPLK